MLKWLFRNLKMYCLLEMCCHSTAWSLLDPFRSMLLNGVNLMDWSWFQPSNAKNAYVDHQLHGNSLDYFSILVLRVDQKLDESCRIPYPKSNNWKYIREINRFSRFGIHNVKYDLTHCLECVWNEVRFEESNQVCHPTVSMWIQLMFAHYRTILLPNSPAQRKQIHQSPPY